MVVGPASAAEQTEQLGLESASEVAGAPANPVSLGVYRPAFPNDLNGLRQVQQIGTPNMAIVHWFALWGGWKSAFSRSDLEKAHAAGATPMISWEPWSGNGPEPTWSLRRAILSGAKDSYIAEWARGLAEYGKPVLLRFAHEMHNQPMYPWAVGNNGNTAEEYVASWHHVRAIFAQHGATNVKWVWNPNTLGDAPLDVHVSLYRSLYPGDDAVDWAGLDIYNTGPSLDWGAPYWRSFDQVLRTPYEAITAVSSKPVVLPEVGCTEQGGSKGNWIAEAVSPETAQRFPKLRAMVWFDVAKEQAWQLTSSEASLQAWRGALNAPLAMDGGPATSLTAGQDSGL